MDNKLVEKIKTCFLCGGRKKAIFLKDDEFGWVKCQSCGLIFREDQLKDPLSYYSSDYFGKPSDIANIYRRLYFNYLIRRLGKFLKGAKRILDLGCGDGSFLEVLNQKFPQIETLGVDPSSAGAEICRAKDIKVCEKTLSECRLSKESFDLVTAFHVLEHLPNPNIELEELKKILKPSGYLILSTPNAEGLGFKLGGKWALLDSPHHTILWSPQQTRLLLEKHGFKIISERQLLADQIYSIYKTWCKAYLKPGVFNNPFSRFIILVASLPTSLLATLFHGAESFEIVAQKGRRY